MPFRPDSGRMGGRARLPGTIEGMSGTLPTGREPGRRQGRGQGRGRGTVLGQGVRFVIVGGIGTTLYVGLYWLFAIVMGPQIANISSWILATLLGNLLHRRFTYGVTGSQLRHTDNIVTFATALVELVVVAVLLEIFSGVGALSQGGLVVIGTIVGGVMRFVMNRLWFARPAATAGTLKSTPGTSAARSS